VITEQAIRAIFVAWQQPQSRQYYPIARLVPDVGDEHDLFEFAYVQGAQDAITEGFQPFLAFPDLLGVYRSRELFPFFTNRLMSHKRPDFPDHVRRLGLDTQADPMLILARSGGTRATDSIELFALPVWDETIGCYRAFFWMHGFRHLEPDNQTRVLALQPGDELLAQPEPTNAWDANAIRLLSPDGVFVGYVPRYLTSDAIHLLSSCVEFHVVVEQVNQDPAPAQQRLLCRLDSCWPPDFEPCSQPAYRPISQQASKVDPCRH
jgi:hypothetical protein